MRCILLANGEYSENLASYQKMILPGDLIVCADGGAEYAKKMNLTPFCIVGDMDSISLETKEFYEKKQIPFRKYPRHKDLTDMQLAMAIAQEQMIKEIIFFGSLGYRLDLTMSNLYAGLEAVKQGIKIMHYSPEMALHLVYDRLEIEGKKGETVSVLTLTDEAAGVNLSGFEYELENTVLMKENPFSVSNRMISERAIITVEQGILAVFHYNFKEA